MKLLLGMCQYPGGFSRWMLDVFFRLSGFSRPLSLPPSPFRSAALLEYKGDLQVKVYPILRRLSHPKRVVGPRVGRTMPGLYASPSCLLVAVSLSLSLSWDKRVRSSTLRRTISAVCSFVAIYSSILK